MFGRPLVLSWGSRGPRRSGPARGRARARAERPRKLPAQLTRIGANPTAFKAWQHERAEKKSVTDPKVPLAEGTRKKSPIGNSPRGNK